MASSLQSMLDPNYGQPIHDYTGRQDPGPGYIPDEYDLMQQGLEDLGVFPIAPGAGTMLSELGDMILYQNSRRGGRNLPTNDLDRFAALPATWAANASKEFGSLLTMKPEQLVQLRRSIDALIQDDPGARSELWEGIKSAGREYSTDPMAAAEDVGQMIVPSSGIMVPGKLSKAAAALTKGRKAETETISGLTPEVTQKLAKGDPIDIASDAPRQEVIIHHVDDWDDASVAEFMDADMIDPNFEPKLKPGVEAPPSSAVTELAGMSDEALDEQIKGINQLLNAPGTMEPVTESNLVAMVKAYAKERDNRRAAKAGQSAYKAHQKDPVPEDWPDIWQKQVMEFDDDMLDAQISEFKDTLKNKNVKGMEIDEQDVADYTKQLQDLLAERKRRQGGEGTAGAAKTQGPLEHMTNYGGKPLDEPGAGWPGGKTFNLENFTEAADFGDLDILLDNAKVGKRNNMWHFREDPDPEIFSLNGFLNRLSNPGHEANNVELVHLVKILAKAKKRSSMGGKKSMAEDLWTKIAGPTKELLRGFGFEL